MLRRYSTKYRTDGGARWNATWWTWQGRIFRHTIRSL